MALRKARHSSLRGLDGVKCDRAPFRLHSGGDPVLPLNTVRVHDELVGGSIVKHHHFLGAHNHQALLFEGMQPAYENVRLRPARECQICQRHIRNPLIEVRTAGAANFRRLFAEQRQDHRDIMRREAPKNVFFGANLANVQTVGVHVLHASNITAGDQLFQLEDGRMVLQNVPDHQDPALTSSQVDEVCPIGSLQCQWLFNEDILAGQQGTPSHLEVRCRWSGQHNCVDTAQLKHFRVIPCEAHAGVLLQH